MHRGPVMDFVGVHRPVIWAFSKSLLLNNASGFFLVLRLLKYNAKFFPATTGFLSSELVTVLQIEGRFITPSRNMFFAVEDQSEWCFSSIFRETPSLK